MLEKKKTYNYQKYFEILFVILCGVFFFYWSIVKRFDFGPDEMMRFHIPEYIYKHGALPNGDMEELRNEMWGFSYAYYPTFLGPLLSAFFMKVTSLFTANEFALVVAARFTSVISGMVTVWFLLKICGRLFLTQTKWIICTFLVCIPQFVFLCSYVNNDIICIAGSAIICYAWILGLQDGWNYKNSILLAVGIIIDLLSYYNSYGWILCSVIIFIFSYVLKVGRNRDYKQFFKWAVFISVVVLLVSGGFFIRNAIIYDGDFLGMSSLTASSEKYAMSNDLIRLKPSERNIAKNLGMSVWEMLEGSHWNTTYNWWSWTYVSFIGVFSYMKYYLPDWIYIVYGVFLAIGLFLFVTDCIYRLFNKKSNYKKDTAKTRVLLKSTWFISFVIPIVLSIYYSYATDYEPQGRYIYPMIVALLMMIGSGLNLVLRKIPLKWLRNVLSGLIITLFAVLQIIVFVCYYLPAE